MNCYKGDTRKKALDEIERYNKMCEKGIDEDFGKDRNIMKVTGLKVPPFYGTIRKVNGMGGLSAGMVITNRWFESLDTIWETVQETTH